MCVECGNRVAHHCGRLCRRCWSDHAVRDRHPKIRPAGASRGLGHTPPKLACRPTSALPGTAEKIEVLRLRVLNGEALFHPADPVCDRRRPVPVVAPVVRVVAGSPAARLVAEAYADG